MQINDDASLRLGASLESLNARIARLAIGLGVRLDDQAETTRLMAQPQMQPVLHERRSATATGRATGSGHSPDQRTSHLREELRGLLVLRYHMETSSLNDNGLDATRQILQQAEEHLIRQGFKPGADGLGLDDFFNAA